MQSYGGAQLAAPTWLPVRVVCGLRVSTTSSAAGATARIAVIVQTGVGFLSGGRRDATADEREDCYY